MVRLLASHWTMLLPDQAFSNHMDGDPGAGCHRKYTRHPMAGLSRYGCGLCALWEQCSGRKSRVWMKPGGGWASLLHPGGGGRAASVVVPAGEAWSAEGSRTGGGGASIRSLWSQSGPTGGWWCQEASWTSIRILIVRSHGQLQPMRGAHLRGT